MPIDDKAKAFLDPTKPIREFKGMQAPADAEDRFKAYREKEYIERAGRFTESLVEFFLHERQRKGYLDDEAVGALALFAINLRELYGQPQNSTEKKTWTDKDRDAKLAIFDSICEEMQRYYDANKDL